jgi:hypothetical protein
MDLRANGPVGTRTPVATAATSLETTSDSRSRSGELPCAGPKSSQAGHAQLSLQNALHAAARVCYEVIVTSSRMRVMVNRLSAAALIAAAFAFAPVHVASATGLATCDSGSPDTWQSQEKLSAMLKEKGWEVRNVKIDGGCYEVYALDDKGERVEAYFHPVTLERVVTTGK